MSKSQESDIGPFLSDSTLEHPLLETLRKRYTRISPEDLIEIVETFIFESSNLLALIERGIKEADISLVAHAAHTLKSSAALLGAKSLSTLCEDLETVALAGDMSRAKWITSQINVEYPRLLTALEKELKKLAGSSGSETALGNE